MKRKNLHKIVSFLIFLKEICFWRRMLMYEGAEKGDIYEKIFNTFITFIYLFNA